MAQEKTIKIIENGPYLVSADILLKKVKIAPLQPEHIKDYDTTPHVHDGFYALCRCGHSHSAPFCDGTHAQIHFDGTETADKTPYMKRVGVSEGEHMLVLDDDRCAFARFCHRQHGSVWEEVEKDDELYKQEIIEGACACPAGRLTAADREHGIYEPEYKPQILVVEDPAQGVSAGLFVQGSITVIGADGKPYEVRNRVALCRCGNSYNKPFCDANHVSSGYRAHEQE
jgi:CDGSH-type Zn-finger protein